MSSKRILSVDEDSESSANIGSCDLIDILSSNSYSSDILLPIRKHWKRLVIEDDFDDEDHNNYQQLEDTPNAMAHLNIYARSQRDGIGSLAIANLEEFQDVFSDALSLTSIFVCARQEILVTTVTSKKFGCCSSGDSDDLHACCLYCSILACIVLTGLSGTTTTGFSSH
ncbi:unnamed protein product [Xylocopa violacea]|uniref:Uncharacterized protein n=1 Tax=Xylocopa violacea TaxID=135666 RepID=A0ABP1PIF7_XYLVO